MKQNLFVARKDNASTKTTHAKHGLYQILDRFSFTMVVLEYCKNGLSKQNYILRIPAVQCIFDEYEGGKNIITHLTAPRKRTDKNMTSLVEECFFPL